MTFRWRSVPGLLASASLAGFFFIVPHTIEDFVYNVPEERFSLDQTAALWLTGPLIALQILGLMLLTGGRRAGVWLTGAAGVAWVLAAVLDHTGDVLERPFRTGFSSTVWVLGIVVTQAVAAAVAAVAVVTGRSRTAGTTHA